MQEMIVAYYGILWHIMAYMGWASSLTHSSGLLEAFLSLFVAIQRFQSQFLRLISDQWSSGKSNEGMTPFLPCYYLTKTSEVHDP